MERYEDAVKVYQQALDEVPESDATLHAHLLTNLAAAQMRMGAYSTVAELSNAHGSVVKRTYDLAYNIACAHIEEKRFDEALTYLDMAFRASLLNVFSFSEIITANICFFSFDMRFPDPSPLRARCSFVSLLIVVGACQVQFADRSEDLEAESAALEVQRAFVLQKLGKSDEALQLYTKVEENKCAVILFASFFLIFLLGLLM